MSKVKVTCVGFISAQRGKLTCKTLPTIGNVLKSKRDKTMLVILRHLFENNRNHTLNEIAKACVCHPPAERLSVLSDYLNTDIKDISPNVEPCLKYDSQEEFLQLMKHMSQFSYFGEKDILDFYNKPKGDETMLVKLRHLFENNRIYTLNDIA